MGTGSSLTASGCLRQKLAQTAAEKSSKTKRNDGETADSCFHTPHSHTVTPTMVPQAWPVYSTGAGATYFSQGSTYGMLTLNAAALSTADNNPV